MNIVLENKISRLNRDLKLALDYTGYTATFFSVYVDELDHECELYLEIFDGEYKESLLRIAGSIKECILYTNGVQDTLGILIYL